jgi:endonuclease/exonuclease/phosphatase family metal-dependent hydrolase
MTSNLLFGVGDAGTILRLADEHRVDVLSLQELTPEAMARLDAAGARARFPGRAVEPRSGAGGSGLLARRPLRPVPTGEPPDWAAQPEALLTVPGSGALHVKAVHPRPPISRQHVADWKAMLRDLPGPRAGGAVRILAGDFNSTLDHAEMRRLLDRGYRDAADTTGDGLIATWRFGKRRPALVIDHVLVPRDVRVRRVSVHVVPGSDHRAVIAELVLPAG